MSLARDPGISWLSSPTVCSMPVLSLMAPNENQLQGSLSQRNKQFLSFFRHSAGGMQHTAAIAGGLGVVGRLQGQRWAGTGAGGSLEGVGVETQLQNFFWAALRGPCWFIHLVVRGENWPGLRLEPSTSAIWGQADVSTRCYWCYVRKQMPTLIRVLLLLSMQKWILPTADNSWCFLFCQLYLTGPREPGLIDYLRSLYFQQFSVRTFCKCVREWGKKCPYSNLL